MELCTTSGRNNQTSTRCSEWRFMRSRKQWTFVITSLSSKVKRSSQELEELLKVSLNVFEVTLLPGYDNNSKDRNEHFASPQIYSGHKSTSLLSLCILNHKTDTNTIPKHFIYIKDLTWFKQRIFIRNDLKNRNLSRNKKYRFCDFFCSQTSVQNHEVQIFRDEIDECDQYELESQQTHLQFTNQWFEMPVPFVVYADFESTIDEKNKYKPIILSCLAMSRIPTIQTQLQVFHVPHTDESDLLPFMDYLIQLQESVKRYLFSEMPLEVTPKVEKDYRFTSICPFCHKKLESDKVRHHAHVVD